MAVPITIAIFAYEDSPTVTENIVPRARQRGHEVRVLRIDRMSLHGARDFLRDELHGVDLAYYRTSGEPPMTAHAIACAVREQGIPSVNCGHDREPLIARKSYETYVAARAGTPVPKTVLWNAPSYDDLAAALGTPFVAKIDDSSRGRNVYRIESAAAFSSLPIPERMNRYVYQEFVPHQWDYRVHMVGDRAVAMYKRIPRPGDFRANVSQGGTMAAVEPERRDELAEAAEALAPHFQLRVCAIDYLCADDGQLYFAEVNDNPGWEESDAEATGVDLTGVTLDYFERLVRDSA